MRTTLILIANHQAKGEKDDTTKCQIIILIYRHENETESNIRHKIKVTSITEKGQQQYVKICHYKGH